MARARGDVAAEPCSSGSGVRSERPTSGPAGHWCGPGAARPRGGAHRRAGRRARSGRAGPARALGQAAASARPPAGSPGEGPRGRRRRVRARPSPGARGRARSPGSGGPGLAGHRDRRTCTVDPMGAEAAPAGWPQDVCAAPDGSRRGGRLMIPPRTRNRAHRGRAARQRDRHAAAALHHRRRRVPVPAGRPRPSAGPRAPAVVARPAPAPSPGHGAARSTCPPKGRRRRGVPVRLDRPDLCPRRRGSSWSTSGEPRHVRGAPGPWPLRQRSWVPEAARRAAGSGGLDDGSALLLLVRDGRWWVTGITTEPGSTTRAGSTTVEGASAYDDGPPGRDRDGPSTPSFRPPPAAARPRRS